MVHHDENSTEKTCDLRTLRLWFERLGLRLEEVWAPIPEELPEQQLLRLRSLKRWVVAYWRFGGREELEARGFWFPPIEPDFDPVADWNRFESWLQGTPNHWGRKREPGAY